MDDPLTEDQKSKIAQFKDLFRFEELKCLRILQANDWDLRVAIDLTLDGAYGWNKDLDAPSINEIIENDENNINNNVFEDEITNDSNFISQSTSSGLRQRHFETLRNNSNNLNNFNVDDDSNDSYGNFNNYESNNNDDSNNDNSDDGENTVSTYVNLWRKISWLFQIPFFILLNTLKAFYNKIPAIFHHSLTYDPNGTVEKFIEEFEEKYGTRHPQFTRGSYAQALEQGKREIRFVLIYLHSPNHKDIDRICNTVIISNDFINLIQNENLIFWACSVDYLQGYIACQSLKTSKNPCLALIGLKNHKMTVMKKIEGFQPLESVVAQIKTAINNNEYSLIAARLERQEREVSSLIRAQQDAAFEESLKADQEKERKKREERERKEKEERLAQKKLDEEKQIKEKIKEMKITFNDLIPAEPEISDNNSWRIMFKLPNGTRLERCFLKSHPVKYLYYFVFCNEENLINFKLRTNFPTRDLPGHSPSPIFEEDKNEMEKTLEQCELSSNIVLFVHDLDS